jgi:hypothetical protein
MRPLESSVNDATTWSISLESLIMILGVSFDNHNMFIVQATAYITQFQVYETFFVTHAPGKKATAFAPGTDLQFSLMLPGPNVIKLFTAVIYRHSMVIPSFCVKKQHYLGNYCRMAVNYHRNIYNIEFTLE